jgi:hypothetical protein
MDNLPSDVIKYGVFNHLNRVDQLHFLLTRKRYYQFTIARIKILSSKFIEICIKSNYPHLQSKSEVAVPIPKKACLWAAQYGNLEALIWLHNARCEWDKWTCIHAAQRGFYEILVYAHIYECPWNSDVCACIAANGDLEILKWARSENAPWDTRTCSMAAKNGHLDILKWAHANGAPWNEWTCTYAAENGHIDILKWARDNGAPWDKDIYVNALEKCYNFLSRCFIIDTKNQNSDHIRKYQKHREVVKWLRDNDAPK